MAVEVARGEITIGLNDRDALNGLNRLRAEYAARMAEIDRMEAQVTLGANTQELDRKLKEARDKVRILKGERATVTIDADKKELDKEIAEAEALVKRLDGRKARIEIETRGMETALAQEEALRKLEAKRASEENKFARQRLQMAQQEARVSSSLERQRQREMATAEKAAYRENEQRRLAGLNLAQEARKVIQLQQEYAKLTDKLENLKLKRRGTFGAESRAKVDLDISGVYAHMEEVKQKLNLMGKHPPVDIRANVDDSFVKRQLFSLRKSADDFLNKFGQGFGKAKINVGPMSLSLRALGTGLATLGPLVTDLVGSATALAGVLGTGLAGAGAIAGGVMSGLALNFGGVYASLKPLATQLKTATQVTAAYNKAVLEHGKNSKQAQVAEAQMNSVLKSVDPNVRRAAEGMGKLSSEWQRKTGATASRDLGSVMTAGIKTLNTLMPTLAHNTNQTFDILSHRIGGVMGDLRKPGSVGIFDSLGKSANTFLNPALRGLEHLGAAFGHVAESAARIFAGPAGRGFDRLAAKIDAATQPGAKLDGTIRRLGHDASDLGHLFMAAGRIIMTVLDGGSHSGDRMVESMTAALDRWNQFLSSPTGKTDMASFFDRSEAGARALWGALAPLIASFVQWSNLLSPFTAGLLQGIGFVSKLVAGLTKLIGLGGPLTALGATIGTIFAVSKLASFVAMLGRVVVLMRQAAAAGSVIGGAKTFFGGIGGALRGAGSMGAGGAEAGAAIQAAMVEGGAAAAAEIRAAMTMGGAAAGAEGVAGMAATESGLLVPRGALAAEGAEASGAAGAMAGLSVATLGVGAALTAAAGAILYFHGKATQLSSVTKTLDDQDTSLANAIHSTNDALAAQAPIAIQAVRSHIDLKNAAHAYFSLVRAGKKDTDAGRLALADYRDAQANNKSIQDALTASTDKAVASAKAQVTTAKASAEVEKTALDQAQQRMRYDRQNNGPLGVSPAQRAKDQQKLTQALSNYNAALNIQTQAEQRARVAELNSQRQLALLPALTDKAAAAMKNLIATQGGGGKISQTIALKFSDPTAVANNAASALKAGVPKSLVLKIVADSKNAEDAVRRINAAKVAVKNLIISGNAGGALRAHGAVAALRNIAKMLTVLGNAGPAVKAHGQAAGLSQLFKMLTVLGNNSAAMGAYNALRGLGDIVKTLIIKTVHQGKATGGPWMPEEKRATQVAARAEASGVRSTRGGRYNRPTLLVGEEDRTEYVIATNPAYRRSNEAYLAAAAADLGYSIEPAVKGKRPKKKQPTGHFDKDAPNYKQRARIKTLDANSIRSDFIDSYYSSAVGEYNKWTNKANSLSGSLRAANNQYHDTPKGAAHDKQRRDLTRRIARLEAQWRTADRRRKAAKAAAVRATNDYQRYSKDRNNIDTLTSEMSVDERNYNATGDPNALADWNKKKGMREAALADIADLLKRVKGYSAAKKYISDLNKQLAATNDDLNASQNQEAPTATGMTADAFIASLGRSAELQSDLKAEALAKVTPDAGDDESARATLQGFYQSVLNAAQASAQPDALITDLANTLSGYLPDGGAGSTSPLTPDLTPDQQAQLDMLTRQNDYLSKSASLNEAAVNVFGGAGDIGSNVFGNAYSAARYDSATTDIGAGAGTQVGPTIIIQTLHPADSATLALIGQAATQGISLQGAITTPRQSTGL